MKMATIAFISGIACNYQTVRVRTLNDAPSHRSKTFCVRNDRVTGNVTFKNALSLIARLILKPGADFALLLKEIPPGFLRPPDVVPKITRLPDTTLEHQRIQEVRCAIKRNRKRKKCCSKVNLSGSNGNVNMSGWKDDNPDDERRETTRHHTTIVT